MKYRYLDWSIESSPQNPGDNAIGILTLNRPDHANAIGPRMTMELHQLVDEIRHSPVRVVIVTGAEGNFSGGGDLQIETMPMEDQKDEWTDYGVKGEYGEMLVWFANDYFHIVAQRMCRKLEDLPQVTIAAVDGIAVGIGLEMAVSCDLRIASDCVRFAEIAVPAGFMSEWSAPRSLPGLIGQTRANEMILTGAFRLRRGGRADRTGQQGGAGGHPPRRGARLGRADVHLPGARPQIRQGDHPALPEPEPSQGAWRGRDGAHLRDHPHR